MHQQVMKQQHALMIFVKNLVHGKVKTRLAASVGNEMALNIYRQLLEHSRCVTETLPVDKIVFYAEQIVEQDMWSNEIYEKQLQAGNDLGERMKNAFSFAFNKGYSKVVIIGTDCPSLTGNIIEDAFKKLETADAVIGPAFDGGYYLLGLKQAHSFLFEHMQWSTAGVLAATIERCRQHGLAFSLLQELHDIDEEKDLVHLNTA
jgi:uncharacterized protein